MYVNTTGFLIICDVLLLFLLIPLNIFSPNMNPYFSLLIILFGGVSLLNFIKFVFKGAEALRYRHAQVSTLQSWLTKNLYSYLFIVTVLVIIFGIIWGLSDEFAFDFNSVFSIVLVYLVGFFYFKLIRTYDPTEPRRYSKRRENRRRKKEIRISRRMDRKIQEKDMRSRIIQEKELRRRKIQEKEMSRRKIKEKEMRRRVKEKEYGEGYIKGVEENLEDLRRRREDIRRRRDV